MKKLFFIALVAILACGQATAQSIKGLWISQENDPETSITMVEFGTKNVLKFASVNMADKSGDKFDATYIYNQQKKTITFVISSKTKKTFKVRWLSKNVLVLTNKDGGLKLARAGTDEDITTKNLPSKDGQ